MTNDNPPPAPPTLTLVEKLYAVHNINNLVPVKLDLDESNYSSWCYFFKIHCNNFDVLKHIEPKTDASSTSAPPTDEWLTADSIVKSWIILTLSPSLQRRFIKKNPKTALDAWEQVESLFQDNKRTRTVALKGELRMLQMGEQSAEEYFSKIDSLVTLLNDLGSDVSEDDVVTYAINGLSEKFGSLAQIIANKDPFPNLATMRSMVTTEELRLRSRPTVLPVNTTPSAPQVLLTEMDSSRGNNSRGSRDSRNNTRPFEPQVCRNFSRGMCRRGTNYWFIHYSSSSSRMGHSNNSCNNRGTTSGSSTRQQQPTSNGLNLVGHQQLLALLQAQQNLLAQYEISHIHGQPRYSPTTYPPTAAPSLAYAPHMGSRPTAPPGFTQPPQPAPAFSPQQQALYATALHGSGQHSYAPGQETLLPQAFSTMSLQEPANANWNMDTGFLDASNSAPM